MHVDEYVCMLGWQAASQKLWLEHKKQADKDPGHSLHFPAFISDHLLLNEREHQILTALMANLPW